MNSDVFMPATDTAMAPIDAAGPLEPAANPKADMGRADEISSL
jgi:hypothetical protein